jgi:hypothetical protein
VGLGHLVSIVEQIADTFAIVLCKMKNNGVRKMKAASTMHECYEENSYTVLLMASANVLEISMTVSLGQASFFSSGSGNVLVTTSY